MSAIMTRRSLSPWATLKTDVEMPKTEVLLVVADIFSHALRSEERKNFVAFREQACTSNLDTGSRHAALEMKVGDSRYLRCRVCAC